MHSFYLLVLLLVLQSCGPLTVNLAVQAKQIPEIRVHEYKTFGVLGWNDRVLSADERKVYSLVSQELQFFGFAPAEQEFDISVDCSLQAVPEKVWVPAQKDYHLVYVPHPRIENAGRYEVIPVEQGGYWKTITIHYLKITLNESGKGSKTIWDCEVYTKEQASPRIISLMVRECFREFPAPSGLPKERQVTLN